MRAFLTGAAGFLGSRVVPALQAEGWRVRASRLRLDHDPIDPGIFDGCDVLLHLAGALKGPPSALCLHNVVATRRLLQAARAASLRRVIVVSSLAVYSCGALGIG